MLYALMNLGGWLPTFDGEASVGYDSNVTRAEYKRDIIDDGLASGSVAAVWNHEIGMMQAATLRAFLEGRTCANSSKMISTRMSGP